MLVYMSKKTVPLSKKGVAKLPDDKPVVYKIKTEGGKNTYTGSAKRGRVQERMTEHLKGGKDYVPGSKVQIDQQSSIAKARTEEKRIIKTEQPKHNKQGRVDALEEQAVKDHKAGKSWKLP